MPPRVTRSKGAATKAAPSTQTVSKHVLPAESTELPKLFILPKQATADARIVTLPHPRYAARPTRYLVCPETGVYEFTRIASPEPRSWMVEADSNSKSSSDSDSSTSTPFATLVTKSADLYVASPMDPLFLVLPALAQPSSASASAPPKRMFLTADDHLDALPQQDSHLADLLRRHPRVRRLLTARMAVVCDSVDAGDESMYRLSEERLLQELLAKARRMAAHLPRSMEEALVVRALEGPVPIVSTTATGAAADGSAPSGEPPAPMKPSDDVAALQRLRVALDYICASYVPSALTAAVKERLAADSPFGPLEAYMAELTRERETVARARSSALDYTRKRGLEDGEDVEEDADARAEKRRRQEEEERRRKASQSRGVRELKKVNVKGMKKLSEFFKKQ